MDDREVARYWDANAAAWARGVSEGWDVYRQYVIAPGMDEVMPPVANLAVLDIGCGEGVHTRRLAERGARVVGVDSSREMIATAQRQEAERPLDIAYRCAPGNDLSAFADEAFDAVVSFMAMMDMADYAGCICEVARVLKPGGWLQYAITHPCMDSPIMGKHCDEQGREIGRVVGNYFLLQPLTDSQRIGRWFWHHAPADRRPVARPFEIPRFFRTVSEYLNTVIQAGLVLMGLHEPYASDAAIAACPGVADTRIWPYLLVVQARRPSHPEVAAL
ncbi:MAG: class I SAM-dependent methyltransferase [Phycisphaerae bacterium]|nr:class I SAM-dependent methyltransferase [Phycisphaerae bacterium]